MPARNRWQKPDQDSGANPEALDVLGVPTIVRSDPSVVRFLVAERTFPAGYCSPAQAHDADDELLYVLEGEITVIDEGSQRRAATGMSVAVPRGRARTYRNDSDSDARGLVISQPGIQTVELFRNLDRAGRAARSAGRRLSDNEVDHIASQYGVRVLRT